MIIKGLLNWLVVVSGYIGFEGRKQKVFKEGYRVKV